MTRILLTNDDGVHAPGYAALERIARQLSDDLWFVAPAEERSGAGHSLTLNSSVRVRQIESRRFAVTGTPTDSVMMALGHLMGDLRPDVILSGVNRGPNLAEDVTYSGTVSAAMEGTLAGIRSVALSQAMLDYSYGKESFACAEAVGADVLRRVLRADWGKGVLINVNFPATAKPKGVRATVQGFRDYGHVHVDARIDPRGHPYYWFAYGREVQNPAELTDLAAVRAGYVSVTPLHLDLTEHSVVSSLRQTLGD